MTFIAKNRFFRFSLVGTGGFIIDAGVLLLLNNIAGLYWGRLISFTMAVIATWLLNRIFTFETIKKNKPLHKEFHQYFMAMIIGGSANYLVYATLVYFVALIAQWPIIGVGVGSIVGLAINYSLAKNWIFKSDD